MHKKWKNYLPVFLFVVCCLFFAAATAHSCAKIDKMVSGIASTRLPTIVLDPGHGGEDGGAAARSGLQEKDVNLAVSLQLQKMLETAGFPVVMTRAEDISIPGEGLKTVRERKSSDLRNRLKLLEKQGDNCVFLSIHQNYFSESKYSGAQIFYSQNNEESKLLAENIRQRITGLLQPQNARENKPAAKSIYLLWNARVPAVIVECGFLSNDAEALRLSQPEYQKQMAFAIYIGFLEYCHSTA